MQTLIAKQILLSQGLAVHAFVFLRIFPNSFFLLTPTFYKAIVLHLKQGVHTFPTDLCTVILENIKFGEVQT